jgi:long-chain fatty acid transport protein
MRRNAVLSAVLALVGLTFAADHALAQGFGVYEHDACQMGRAGTGVAAPCSNASAVFANPAGIVNDQAGPRWNLSFGVTAIAPTFNFTDSLTGTTTDAVKNTIPVPNFYVTRQMGQLRGRPWAIGIGVFAPYGLVSEWPETFSGRFLAYYSDLKSVYVQPTAAVQLEPGFSVGAGLDVIYSQVKLRQRADLSGNQVPSATVPPGTTFGQLGIPAGTDFADAELTGSGTSVGGHFGLLVTSPRFNFGLRYLLRATAGISGDAAFTQVPTGIVLPPGSPLNPTANAVPLDSVLAPTFSSRLARQGAAVDIPLPDQLVVGAAYRPTQKLRVLLDVQVTFWSAFEELELVFDSIGTQTQWEDYRNTIGVRLGGEYTVNPTLTLRAGGLYQQAAAPPQTVTPLLPEAERQEVTLGGSIRIGARGQLDFAYQHIWQADRRGRIVAPTARGENGARVNSGLYGGGARLFGANLVWRF